MSKQFDTFDNDEDRRELVLLFQKLGGDLPDLQAREIRARWLEQLINESTSVPHTLHVNPASCHPVGAYMLFAQIVGVLGVSVRSAAVQLDRFVTRRLWHET